VCASLADSDGPFTAWSTGRFRLDLDEEFIYPTPAAAWFKRIDSSVPGQPEGGVMGETKESAGKVNIDKELLAILCCPETKQEVTLADEGLIAQLNARVGRGELKNKSGQPVNEKLDGGLIRADRKILYPIREDIPVMLIEEGIPIENLS